MSDAAVTEKAPSLAIKAILGQKVGMTQIFDVKGNIIPVTVIQAGPCHVIQVLTPEKHGYSAVQVAFGGVREKNVNKPSAGIFKKANVPASRWLREFRTKVADQIPVGSALRVDAFVPGDLVDVQGLSKGRGYAGSVKRHNFGGGPTTHGQSDRTRAPGSSGSNTYPGRVFKGKKFPGHFGVETTTVQSLEIVQVIPEKDLLLIRGAVPGPNQSLLTIQQTVKRIKVRAQPAADAGKKDKAGKKDAGKAPAAKKGGK